MAISVFGPGALYLTRTDIANQTPYNIGYVNEFSFDLTADTKSLYGQNQLPLAIGRSTVKATGKAKAAQLSGLALNASFYGSTFSAGSIQLAAQIPGTVPGVSTYTVTPTVPNSGTWSADLGVFYANTGLPLVKVASVSAIGQYSVSAGVYTFFSGDASTAMLFNFAYTTAATTMQTSTITNQLIGTSPIFQLDYATTWNNTPYYLRFYQAIANKLSQQFKITDFMMPELDFEFFANAAGNLMTASYGQVS